MLAKLFIPIALLVPATTTMIGCGGGDSSSDACTGHLCSGSGAALTDPEGGNMLFEYIYFDKDLQAAFKLPAGVTTVNRIMTFFMDAQTPEDNPLPTPGQCNRFSTTKGWPMDIGIPQTDLDVGTVSVTGPNKAGTMVTTDVPKQPKGSDNIGRPHDIFYQIIQPDADKFIAPGNSYTVTIGGAGSIPATTLKDAIFLSNDFTVSQPGLDEDTPFVVGTDSTVKWTPAATTNLPKGDEVLGVTWLVDSNGSPTHMCPTSEDAGQFTIPGATLAEYRQDAMARGTNPNVVILLRNAIVHHVLRLPNGEANNKRRFDALSVDCWAQLLPLNPQI